MTKEFILLGVHDKSFICNDYDDFCETKVKKNLLKTVRDVYFKVKKFFGKYL